MAISGDNPRLTFLSRTGTVIRSWPGRYDHPSYSPDGKKLVVTLPSSATSLFDLAVLNASTGAVVQWIRRNTGLIEEFPSWSPDGRYILYNRCCAPGDWSLRLVTPQGATVRAFGAGYTGAFSPDGSLVLNASKGSVFDVQSGAFVAHLFPQFSLSFPSWSAGSLPPS